jgi:hypothetical protein
MAVYLEVFLKRSQLPTFNQWADAISKEGFPLTFPEPVDLAKHTGYLPAVFRGEHSGFEFNVADLKGPDEMPEGVPALGLPPDVVVGFRFHEMDECHAATIAAAVLASLCQGLFFDPQGGGVSSGKDALANAREQLDAAAREEAAVAAKRRGNLTTAKWAKFFEQNLRRVHPDYRPNKHYGGRLLECIREGVTGLFLSQNCIRVHDTYRQCFAVLLTTSKLGPALFSPFVLGSRFDHNYTVSHAYHQDYRPGDTWDVAPKEWHSEHRATEREAQEWVEHCARSAEEFLFPLYVNRLRHGADAVASLFVAAAALLREWGISQEALKQAVPEGDLATAFAIEYCLRNERLDWHPTLVARFNALRLAEACGVSAMQMLKFHRQAQNTRCEDIALGTGQFMDIPEDIRNAALVVAYIEDFLAVEKELLRIVRVVEGLKGPSSPMTPQNPKLE